MDSYQTEQTFSADIVNDIRMYNGDWAFIRHRTDLGKSFLISPQPKAHRWAYCIPMFRRPSVHRRRSQCSNFFYETAWPIKAGLFCGASMDRGNEILFAASLSRPRWPPCSYVVKTFKILLLRNQWTDFHETWWVELGALAIIVCSNDEPRLTQT